MGERSLVGHNVGGSLAHHSPLLWLTSALPPSLQIQGAEGKTAGLRGQHLVHRGAKRGAGGTWNANSDAGKS